MLQPGICKISGLKLMKKSLLRDDVKVNITIDDIRVISHFSNEQTEKFTKKSLFCTISGFTQSNSGPLGDIEGFVQKIPRSYKSEKHNNITGIDEEHFKCD